MWQWQNSGAASDGAPPNTSNPSVAPATATTGHPQGTGELQDMLQMLDHHTGAAPFEDLNMFNPNFE